jgi:hypothetical protein
MSFDERMALYKRKYDSTTPGAAASQPAGKKRRSEQSRENRFTQPKPQDQAAPAKKGLLSRIAGIFRKSGGQ